jgi:hypothetical protein
MDVNSIKEFGAYFLSSLNPVWVDDMYYIEIK